MSPQPRRINVRIIEWILERKSWFYYLIPPDPYGRLNDLVSIKVNEAFFKEAARYMNAFMEKGEMPPDQIAPAIFNMLDDYTNGRDVVIRTGDYIAMQSFLRQTQKG